MKIHTIEKIVEKDDYAEIYFKGYEYPKRYYGNTENLSYGLVVDTYWSKKEKDGKTYWNLSKIVPHRDEESEEIDIARLDRIETKNEMLTMLKEISNMISVLMTRNQQVLDVLNHVLKNTEPKTRGGRK